MRGQRRPGRFAESGDDVHHARRKTGFLNEMPQPQRAQRRFLGDFQDDRATGCQSRAEFPGRHQQRKIPRDNLTDDTDRLAERVGMKLGTGHVGHGNRNRCAFDFRCPAGHVTEQVDRQGDIGRRCDGTRFPVIQRFNLGQFLEIGFHQIREFPEKFSPLRGRHRGPLPSLKRLPGRSDGFVDIRLVPLRHGRNRLVVRRVFYLERLPGGSSNPLPVNQQFVFPIDEGERFTTGGRRGGCQQHGSNP